jgi:hypothetical protein
VLRISRVWGHLYNIKGFHWDGTDKRALKIKACITLHIARILVSDTSVSQFF